MDVGCTLDLGLMHLGCELLHAHCLLSVLMCGPVVFVRWALDC